MSCTQQRRQVLVPTPQQTAMLLVPHCLLCCIFLSWKWQWVRKAVGRSL